MNFPIKYIGDGSLIVRIDGFSLQPDFIVEGTNKLIELGIKWNEKQLLDGPKTKLSCITKEERKKLLEKAGYEVLMIDATDWKSGFHENTFEIINNLKKRLREYIGNGLRIDFIHRVVEEVEVFNLYCEPYNNYFVRRMDKGGKYILAHNCIIPPTTRNVEGKVLTYKWLSAPTFGNLSIMPSLSSTPEVVGAIKKMSTVSLNINDYLFLGEGQRNDGLFRLARSLLNRIPKQNVYDMIVNIANNYKPPLLMSDVETIFKQAVRYYEEQKNWFVNNRRKAMR